MKKTTLQNPENNSLIGQLNSLYGVLKNNRDEGLEVNLSGLSFPYPLLLLPISVLITKNKLSYTFKDKKKPSFYQKIGFPKGFNSISLFKKQIQNDKIIPITVLEKNQEEREKLQSLFDIEICKQLNLSNKSKNVILYPISELTTNIFEHSKSSEGYIFAQLNSSKEYLDVCILDMGIGLANSYKKSKGIELSDEEAIRKALQGSSAKSNRERGYGIRTSKELITVGLEGEFLLISGSSALISGSEKEESIIDLPNFNWKGTIITFRIPKPVPSVDILNYVE